MPTQSATASVQGSPNVPQEVTQNARSLRTAIVILSDTVAPNLQQYLNSIISIYKAGEVIFIGSEPRALKQAKMDCYTVAGKAGQNVSVHTAVTDGTNVGTGLSQALRPFQSRTICGVLYCLGSSEIQNGSDEQDILSLDEREMESALQVRTQARLAALFSSY